MAIQEFRLSQADEKLAARRVGILRARHGQDTAHVRFLIKLCLNLVARSAGAPPPFGAGIFGQRIAALNHETFDDAMKGRAIIKALARQLFEILDGIGRHVRPECHHHFALSSFNDGYFVCVCVHCILRLLPELVQHGFISTASTGCIGLSRAISRCSQHLPVRTRQAGP